MPINPFCKTALEMCDSSHQAIIQPEYCLNFYDAKKIQLIKDVPKGPCILLYKPGFYTLWQRLLQGYTEAVQIDFNYFQAKFFQLSDQRLLTVCLLPIGAPAAVLCAEEIGALGFRDFIEFGICGSLHEKYMPGHFFLVDQAVRDEGTSAHYLDNGFFAFANFEFSEVVEDILRADGLKPERGVCWSTDGFYRETVDKCRFLADKIQVVNMESSALFALGRFRRYRFASLQIVSDILRYEEKKWQSDFSAKPIQETASALVRALMKGFC